MTMMKRNFRIDNNYACIITMQFQKTIGGGGMMLEGLDKGLIFEFLDKYPKLSIFYCEYGSNWILTLCSIQG